MKKKCKLCGKEYKIHGRVNAAYVCDSCKAKRRKLLQELHIRIRYDAEEDYRYYRRMSEEEIHNEN